MCFKVRKKIYICGVDHIWCDWLDEFKDFILKKYRDDNILNRFKLTYQICNSTHKTVIISYIINWNRSWNLILNQLNVKE